MAAQSGKFTAFKASKLLFRAVVELNPEVTFVIGGVLAISVH